MNPTDIQLTLTLTDINQILEALGDRPYKEVFSLIGKIQQQAEGQLQTQSQETAMQETATNEFAA